MRLYHLAKLPQRPSDLLSLREQGFDAYTRLSFDLAVAAFGMEFEAAQQATIEVPATKERRKPTTQKQKYDEADFRRFLGIPDEEASSGSLMPADPTVDALVNDILQGRADWLMPKDHINE